MQRAGGGPSSSSSTSASSLGGPGAVGSTGMVRRHRSGQVYHGAVGASLAAATVIANGEGEDDDNDSTTTSSTATSSSSEKSHLLPNGSAHGIDHDQRSHAARSTTTPATTTPTLRDCASDLFLLTFLYLLQGIPVGLVTGSIPFLLQAAHVSYSLLGVFSVAVWPYSFKLLWSPIVDAVYAPSMGRRKSWIVPTQFVIAAFLWHLSTTMPSLLHDDGVSTLTAWYFALIVVVATQDIAVDGWAITLLPTPYLPYASTCQSTGQTIGFFISYTMLLAFGDADFCNRLRGWLSVAPQTAGFVSIEGFLQFWAVMFVVSTVYLWVFKREDPFVPSPTDPATCLETYSQIWGVLKLKNVQMLALVLITSRIAFAAADNLTLLKLTEKGVPKENLAFMVVCMFPLEIIYPSLVGYWSSRGNALIPFLYSYPVRIALSFGGYLVVQLIDGPPPFATYALAFGMQVMYSFVTSAMFVSQCGLFAQVSDESIGGTYMTLLTTIANLGNTLPRFFVLRFVDTLTCPASEAASASEASSSSSSSSVCSVLPRGTDGYTLLIFACALLGVVWYVVLRRELVRLGQAPKSEWALARTMSSTNS